MHYQQYTNNNLQTVIKIGNFFNGISNQQSMQHYLIIVMAFHHFYKNNNKSNKQSLCKNIAINHFH